MLKQSPGEGRDRKGEEQEKRGLSQSLKDECAKFYVTPVSREKLTESQTVTAFASSTHLPVTLSCSL